MANVFGYQNREVVRVKVKKCDGLFQPEYKKFSVDPQLTSFEVLQSLLARAFDIKGPFTISYLSKDTNLHEVYTSLLSDWDLDAAFLSASDPCLRIKVDLKPFDEGLDDWDIIAPTDVAPNQRTTTPSSAPVVTSLDKQPSFLGNLTGQISSQIGKTVFNVQKAVGIKSDDDLYKPVKSPMGDAEFHTFLDGDGRLMHQQALRLSVYRGGVEPSLRRVVWRHLLNLFPEALTGQERFAFLKAKSEEYYQLRDKWRDAVKSGVCTEDVKHITNMVKKDVLRTDRMHKFYAGSDENKNVLALFNILVTYALAHPSVSYCQGMSDIASPILVIQKDEAQAYLCFCAIMRRMKVNFMLDGYAMSIKFQHLTELLQYQDPEFFQYLKEQGADDLLFTYRWLLLELKREFPFDDACFMLEVMWSSLPPDPPDSNIDLVEPRVVLDDIIYKTGKVVSPVNGNNGKLVRQESAYQRLRTLRRQATSPCTKSPPTVIIEDSERVVESSDACGAVGKKESLKLDLRNGSAANTTKFSPDITPLEEEKFIEESQDFLSLEDSFTSSILAKSTSIDRSLEGPVVVTSQSPQPKLERQEALERRDSKREINGFESFTDSSPGGEGIVIPVVSSSTASSTTYLITDSSSNRSNTSSHLHQSESSPDLLKSSNNGNNSPPFNNKEISVDSNENISSPSKRKTRPPNLQIPDSNFNKSDSPSSGSEKSSSLDFIKVRDPLLKLPSPDSFGFGNPFMMFLCLTLLLQHRDHIMRNNMDYNELAMHFDKMVRKHSVYRVLNQAQSLYAIYLKAQQAKLDRNGDSSEYDVSV
ncbi:TBC1 domain family member 25-like [Tubulanus polymorphus]|uniref:TBC1 domain family member 25-like n=1 Tax=Tubulanus polymorphus TaxID=672921 RepID=UPI003DA64B45